MIILRPYETRAFVPVTLWQWREPSQAQPKDQFGNPCVQTRFRVRAMTHDGVYLWIGWFDSREDFDAFSWAIATGSIHRERALWDLPTPMWPGLDPGLLYDFATTTFLTTTGSNQTYTKPADFTDGNNEIHCIGGGAGGAATNQPSSEWATTAGGGGAWSLKNDDTLAATETYRVGSGGAAVINTYGNGNAGSDSWFGATTLASSVCGAKAGGIGAYDSIGPTSGGAGGLATGGIGDVKVDGGDGGAVTGSTRNCLATGGGGAGSPGVNNAGAAGGDAPDLASASGDQAGDGGSSGGGAAGSTGYYAGSSTAANVRSAGASSTEFDATHGSGAGGGGANRAPGISGQTYAGDGGGYGGGGGACSYGTSSDSRSGAGGQGLVVVIYYPPLSLVFDPSPHRHILVR